LYFLVFVRHLGAGNPVSVRLFGEIRCQFVFSGKNDELTPDFPGKNDELTPDFPSAPINRHVPENCEDRDDELVW